MNLKALRKNKTFKSGSKYSLASTFLSFANMFVGLIIMRWLDPMALGTWNTFSIFLGYLPFLQFGIQNGLGMELPVLLGRNDPNFKYLISSAKWYSYFISILCLFIGLISAILSYHLNSELHTTLGIITIFIIASGVSLNLHLISTFRSSRSFDRLSNIYLIEGVIVLVSSLLIYFYGYIGILAFNIIIVLQHSFFLSIYAPFKSIKPKRNNQYLRSLLKRGLSIMSFYQLRIMAQSLPKWVILYFAGAIGLGLFSPALAIKKMMNLLPSQLNQFLTPKFGFKYGKNGKASEIWPYLRKINLLIPVISLPFAFLIIYAIPDIIEFLFPKYIDSIPAIRIMAMAFIFSSYSLTHNFLYVIKAYREARVFSFIELILYAAAPLVCVFTLSSSILESVSVGILICNIALFLLNYFLLQKTLRKPKFNQSLE